MGKIRTGWRNPYPVEPYRSTYLLTRYHESLKKKGSPAKPTRYLMTAQNDSVTDCVLVGYCTTILHGLPQKRYQCIVTSSPYHAARDYDHPDQIGDEPTVADDVRVLVQDVFRPARDLLADDGLLWIVVADRVSTGARGATEGSNPRTMMPRKGRDDRPSHCMLQIPDQLAIAMVNDGWILVREIIWHKPMRSAGAFPHGPQPCHEKILLFAKSARHKYHAKAVRLPALSKSSQPPKERYKGREPFENSDRDVGTVWYIPVETAQGVSAAFPDASLGWAIRRSSEPGDAVLDPLGGSGTVGAVAARLGRSYTLIEINRSMVFSSAAVGL